VIQRLAKHNYWKQSDCILVWMGGVTTRASGRLVRRLADDKGLPVYVFIDGDPCGYSNIYRPIRPGFPPPNAPIPGAAERLSGP
jgi:DNA topoisomerase-6 subunit A